MRFTAVLLAAALTFSTTVVRADDPPICGEAPEDADVRRRLEVLSRHVRQEEPPIRRWFTTFALLHGTMLVAAVVLAASAENDGARNDMLVGATSSALAVTTLVIFSPALLGAGDTLNGMPEDTPEERLVKMRAAESILARSSNTVDFLHSWFPATLTSLYLGAAGATLLLAFDRATTAFTHTVGGVILGMGRVLLHPTGSRDAWRSYRRANPDANCEEAMAPPPEASWQLSPAGVGLGLTVNF